MFSLCKKLCQWICCGCCCGVRQTKTRKKHKRKTQLSPTTRTTSTDKGIRRSRVPQVVIKSFSELLDEKEILELIPEDKDVGKDAIEYLRRRGFDLSMNDTNRLGSGTYAVVYKAWYRGRSLTGTENTTIACKVIKDKKQLSDRQPYHPLDKLRTELAFLASLKSSEFIVKPIKYFVSNRQEKREDHIRAYVFMEFASGGSLKTLIKTTGKPMDELTAKHYFGQIVRGVRFLHKNGIAHRDLKTDNILMFPAMVDNETPFVCKISDFGTTRIGYENNQFIMKNDYVGTRQFMAPEILACNPVFQSKPAYDVFVADCWALGVILYVMIVGGSYPFRIPNKRRSTLVSAIRCQKQQLYDWPDNYRQQQQSPPLTKPCIELIRRILIADTNLRLSIDEIVASEWLIGETTLSDSLAVGSDRMTDR
ncbi:testis-specific serine/threonine-protein kinase 1-like [Oppia nitens]|uniref:testis-specific serine/threonine-protein kinase 1-like n=1 Tax=Oppia nitens TaxID=1686743 RepID=UPI0023DB4B6E|nr:testis-specific serine/threonine-protein kinase 1-like [Oppia nitens]